jgi:signal peptide peptidase SppA
MSNLVAKKLSKLCGKLFYADADAINSSLENLDTIVANFEEGKTVFAMEDEEGMLRTNPYYIVRDGVAAIPVFGTLLNRCNGSYGFVTGYQFIRNAFNTALADENVKGILFDIDSPGGQASGCFELVDYLASRRGEKPTKAIVNNEACSAAYAIACATDEISSIPSAIVGSIGMFFLHRDATAAHTMLGLKYTIIRAGAHKALGSPYEPLTDELRGEMQDEVDAGYLAFKDRVTALRDISMATLDELDSRAINADKALQLGLIDKIEDEEEAFYSFVIFINKADEELDMDKEEVDVAGIAAKAVTDERTRIKGIMTSEEAKGREDLAAKLAFDTDMGVEMAVDLMKSSPKVEITPVEQNAFNALMDATDHPEIGAEDGKSEGENLVAQILNAQSLATGRVFN